MASWVLPSFQQNWSQNGTCSEVLLGSAPWSVHEIPFLLIWGDLWVANPLSIQSWCLVQPQNIRWGTISPIFGYVWLVYHHPMSIIEHRTYLISAPTSSEYIYVTIGYIPILSPSTKTAFLGYWNQHQNMRAAKDRYPPSLYWYHQCAFAWISQAVNFVRKQLAYMVHMFIEFKP